MQSIRPWRPLFLPIVFSLGARIENVSLRSYLTNPTKISNALRQIRSHLRSDGMTCYFDPLLEAEAMGGALDWESGIHRPTLRWPRPSRDGELPEGLCSPEETPKRGRIPIAVDVITRLKPLVRDNFLLMAGITGPFTLAAQLAQLDVKSAAQGQNPPQSALNLAADVVPVVARALVEAGANLIMIREDLLPAAPAEISDWASRLLTTINIVRFYEALPVLLLGASAITAEVLESVLSATADVIACPPIDASNAGFSQSSKPAARGIALPASAFDSGSEVAAQLAGGATRIIAGFSPVLVTTSSDLPPTTDLKYLNAIAEVLNP